MGTAHTVCDGNPIKRFFYLRYSENVFTKDNYGIESYCFGVDYNTNIVYTFFYGYRFKNQAYNYFISLNSFFFI